MWERAAKIWRSQHENEQLQQRPEINLGGERGASAGRRKMLACEGPPAGEEHRWSSRSGKEGGGKQINHR